MTIIKIMTISSQNQKITDIFKTSKKIEIIYI